MNRLLIVLLALVLFSACQVTPTEFSREGFYVGATLLGAGSNFENVENLEDLDDVEYAAGIGIRGGYRFLERFAGELAFQTTSDWANYDVSIYNLAIQGKFYPLTGAVQPYVLGGVGAMQVDVGEISEDYSGSFARLGGGLEIYLLSFLPIIVELEYSKGMGDTSEFDFFDGQIGVLWRF